LDGFQFGSTSVQFDDTLLLIEPEAAKAYEAGQIEGGAVPPPHAGGFSCSVGKCTEPWSQEQRLGVMLGTDWTSDEERELEAAE